MNDRIHRIVITGASSGNGLDMARAFLARGSPAGFVTGTTLAVDGGYSHGR